MAIGALLKVYTPVGIADTSTSVTTSSTAAVALPANAKRIWFVSAEAGCIIFGASDVAAAVVATCMPYQADTDYVFDVRSGVTHYRAIALATTGLLQMSAVD